MMVGLLWWKKKLLIICLLISTECTNVTDSRTDRQTDGHARQYRQLLRIASRGNKSSQRAQTPPRSLPYLVRPLLRCSVIRWRVTLQHTKFVSASVRMWARYSSVDKIGERYRPNHAVVVKYFTVRFACTSYRRIATFFSAHRDFLSILPYK